MAVGGQPLVFLGWATDPEKAKLLRAIEDARTQLQSGRATLVAGLAVVRSPWIRSESNIVVSYMTLSGTTGTLSWDTLVPASGSAQGSFTIRSSSTTDTSTVVWMMQA